MSVLWYLLVPAIVVAVATAVLSVRAREPTSLESGVEAFRREMQALAPGPAPLARRQIVPDGALAAGDPPTGAAVAEAAAEPAGGADGA